MKILLHALLLAVSVASVAAEDASLLAKQAGENSLAVEARKGEIITLDGQVDKVGSGFAGVPFVLFKSPVFTSVQCIFAADSAEVADLAKLTRGQRVRIQGKLKGVSLGLVVFTDSTLIEPEPVAAAAARAAAAAAAE